MVRCGLPWGFVGVVGLGDGARVVITRSLPKESRSMCVLDWYHKNAPDCIAYPLIATPDTTKDLGGTYTANLQFNITFTKPEVYVFVSKFLFPLNLVIQMMSSL